MTGEHNTDSDGMHVGLLFVFCPNRDAVGCESAFGVFRELDRKRLETFVDFRVVAIFISIDEFALVRSKNIVVDDAMFILLQS